MRFRLPFLPNRVDDLEGKERTYFWQGRDLTCYGAGSDSGIGRLLVLCGLQAPKFVDGG
jgi:ABC-type Fe3+-hydroxamate transport system substrate-binding protein